MATSRSRIPPRGLRGVRGLLSIIAFLVYCACLSVVGSLVTESVREQEVNGIVGQSALLSGSLCTPIPGSELRVEWYFYPNKTPLVRLIRSQCSPYPDKPGYNCSDRELVITASHIGRIDLYRDNGSLLLRDLRSNDSGVYKISVYCGGNDSVKFNVTLTVHNETENTNSATTTIPQTTSSSPDKILFNVLWPLCLGVIVAVAICLSLKITRTYRGCGCKSDTTEKIVQSNAVSWEELDENKDRNSQADITYSFLQLPLLDSTTTTQGPENCIIYSAPRKNKDQNSHGDLTYSILQLPLPDSPTTTQGPETHIIYSAPRKVH